MCKNAKNIFKIFQNLFKYVLSYKFCHTFIFNFNEIHRRANSKFNTLQNLIIIRFSTQKYLQFPVVHCITPFNSFELLKFTVYLFAYLVLLFAFISIFCAFEFDIGFMLRIANEFADIIVVYCSLMAPNLIITTFCLLKSVEKTQNMSQKYKILKKSHILLA